MIMSYEEKHTWHVLAGVHVFLSLVLYKLLIAPAVDPTAMFFFAFEC